MRRVYNLIMLCILLICQQDIVAQSYNLGKQKQSFAYKTLYAKRPQKSEVVKSNNEVVKTQPIQKAPTEAELKAIQIKEDIQKIKESHKSIIKLTSSFPYSTAYDIYEKLYKKLLNTEENLQTIRKIQPVVILYLNSRGTAFPQIEKQLKNSSSIEEQINIFLSYSQEQ
jgi:hypothetical protein